jgi:3',5'-cyclic AMP phosphodiesterase CpdA
MFKLAHLSDPHLGPLPAAHVAELLGKRITGFLSWHLNRRRIHDMRSLQQLLEDIKAHRPDHIALTGDLINIALPGEYENALTWLSSLGSPENVSLVPGNHDAYIAGAWKRGFPLWSAYYAGDMRLPGLPSPADSPSFPFVRLRRNIALIGVSTARPTGIGIAAGWLGREQIEALHKLLRHTRERGFFRVLMIHHPPVSGICPRRKSLLDAAELAPVLEKEGTELVLFGHDHRHHYLTLPSDHGQIHIFGVPSASLLAAEGTGAGWNLYTIRRQEGSWLTDVLIRVLDSETGQMRTRSNFQLVHRGTTEMAAS